MAGLIDIRSGARLGLCIALVATTTLIIRLPMPATEGYINLGDAVIIAIALLWGPIAGALAGGLGSSLADVLGGYAHWAPFTLFIKGLEGVVIGVLFRMGRDGSLARLLAATAAFSGVMCMFMGYFLVEWILYGPGPALASAPGNLVQALSSLVLGLPLAMALRRSGLANTAKSA